MGRGRFQKVIDHFMFRKGFALSILAFLFFTMGAMAQVINLSDNPDQFLDSFEKVFKDGKNAVAMEEFAVFKNNYSQSFDEDSKKNLMVLAKTMAARNHKMPEYYQLLKMLNLAQNRQSLQPDERANLLGYLTEVVKSQTARNSIRVITQLHDFFDKKLIYSGNFNKLYLAEGSYSFEFAAKEKSYFQEASSTSSTATDQKPADDLFGDFNEEAEVDPWDDPSLASVEGEFSRNQAIPKVSNLLLVLQNASIAMVTASDSFLVRNTNAAIDLLSETFVAKGGEANYENVLLPEAKVYFDEYFFKINNPYLMAEKVMFQYPEYLEDSVEGVFEYRGVAHPKGVLSTYPRFKSYDNKAVFKNLQEGLSYQGGFSLIGNRKYSTSLFNNFSTLWVNKDQPNNFKVIGTKIEFTDSLITADQVIFTTILQNDSIYHPAVKLRYNLKEQMLNLYKLDRGGFRNSMYSDTFHEMDIKCDAMRWDLKTGKMDFYIIAGRTEVAAIFESFNYYNPGVLRQLSSEAGYNPLIFLGNYVIRKKQNKFTISEIQDALKLPPAKLRNGILLAHQMGFINYDPYTDTYSITRKGIHYFNSSIGKTDYDDLAFASLSKGGNQNASIDRNSNALDIAGAQEFKLSDSLGIRFLPKDNNLKMEGSKSFKFAGEIIVKNYTIYGDFEVDYEKFLVNLNRIDSILFTPAELFKKGAKMQLGRSMAYGKTGTLFLNAPDNKSGRKKLPQYPRLLIPEGALVHFDEPYRYKNGYDENVYFKIDKIDHDSLNAVDIAYKGVFQSNGIFQPINETLIVMPDTSIGFSHKASSPYKLYGNSSTMTFTNNLKMTRRGLVSRGKLSHLAASFDSDSVWFGSQELIAFGKKANIKESQANPKAYFPDVNITDYTAKWTPEADSMIVQSAQTFTFYQASTELKGDLVLRSSGLYGKGNLIRKDSEASSEDIKFNKSGFLASRSHFIIKADQEGAKAILDGQNVQTDFLIDKQIVNISPQRSDFNDTLASGIIFPNAAYKTTIDNATWDIKKRIISMKGNVENSTFSSTAPSQYGLNFNGEAALYNIAANTLNVSGVPGISTVDAIIVPNDGKVSILSDSKLEPFKNATVIADTINRYHTLTNANITINSKLSYSGDASYQFVNVSSDTFNIKMGNFEFAEISPTGEILRSKKSGKLSTIARSKVTEKDSIFLSPKMLYIGDLVMMAPFKNLNLNGQVTPILEKYPILGSNWINYSGNKSEEILINVDETLKDGGKPLFAGLHLRSGAGSEALYPTFLSAKRSGDDDDLFLANGIFKRDEPNKRFVINPKEEGPRIPKTNTYELYDELGQIRMSGIFNFFQPDLAEMIQTIGIGNLQLDSVFYTFDLMMKFNVPLPPPFLLKMGDKIVKTNLDIGNSEPAFVFDSPEFMEKMSIFLNPKEAEDYKTQYYKGHVPLFKQSPKFYSSLMISDLKLKWNPVFNSYYSTAPIGIANIGETDINATIPGYFELIKNPRGGDEFYLFLEVSPENWYYFGYKNGQLGFISSDYEQNKILTDKDKTSAKGIEIISVDMPEAMAFRKRFLISYMGVKEEAFKKPDRVPVSAPGQITPVPVTPVPTPGNPTAPIKKPEPEKQDGF